MISTNSNNTVRKPLTSSIEDYLEAIFDLGKQKKVVRVKDIAGRMNVKMPTVTSMLKTLSGKGLVHYEKYEYVELTNEGADVGREMRRRHDALRTFLTDILKIDFERADEEACRMEHTLSLETLDSFTDFMEFVQTCPRAGESWLQRFKEYRMSGHMPEKCKANIENFSCEIKKQVDSMEV